MCNNGVLSTLDTYGCGLFDEYFHDSSCGIASINFRYEYNRLLRWLLKISYNASRSVGLDTVHLRRCAPYILGTKDSVEDVWLLAVLVEPFNGIVKGEHKIVPPMGVRAARVESANDLGLSFIVRLVSINAFYFFIVITKEGELADYSSAKRLLLGKQISRTRRNVVLKPSGLDTLEVWGQHLSDKDHLYREHFAHKKAQRRKTDSSE